VLLEVMPQAGVDAEGLSAVFAGNGRLGVHFHVVLQVAVLGERQSAVVADERLFVGMGESVLVQVAGLHELFATVRTFVLFDV
jgi:hypothetical protein